MPYDKGHLRVISVGMLRRGDEVLALKAQDKVKGITFWRLLGGGIEFGETASQTLQREFREELGVEIIVGERLAVSENIFTYNGTPGHEIAFVYEIKFADPELYNCESFTPLENELQNTFFGWVKISPENVIFPEIVHELK